MARRDRPPNDGGELRKYLRAEAKSVLAFFLGHDWPLGGHSSYEPTPAEIAAWPLGAPVRDLAGGEAYRLHRRDLPDWHPARYSGDLGDALVLGADDVLRPAP